MVADKHIAAKITQIDIDKPAETGRAMMQQQIEMESLIGKNYKEEKCESILMWLKIACRGNWSLRWIEDVKVRLSQFSNATDLL